MGSLPHRGDEPTRGWPPDHRTRGRRSRVAGGGPRIRSAAPGRWEGVGDRPGARHGARFGESLQRFHRALELQPRGLRAELTLPAD